jgi:hypothetical protein
MALNRVVLTPPLSGCGGWASGRTHLGSWQNRSVPGEGTPAATCETSHSQECWSPILQAWGCLSWNQRAPDEGAPTATCETLHSLEFWLPILQAWGCLPWNQRAPDEGVPAATCETLYSQEYWSPVPLAWDFLPWNQHPSCQRDPRWQGEVPSSREHRFFASLCLETKGSPIRRHPLSYCLGAAGGRRPGAWDGHTFMPQATER